MVELLIFGESIHDHWLGKPRKTVGKDEEKSLTELRKLSTLSFCPVAVKRVSGGISQLAQDKLTPVREGISFMVATFDRNNLTQIALTGR